MENNKLAAVRVPMGECPFCKHKQFFVSEIVQTNYLLNRDGQVIDSAEAVNDTIGICLNCNHKFPMKAIFDGFVPMTPLRKFMDDYIDYDEDILEVKEVDNPMQKER